MADAAVAAIYRIGRGEAGDVADGAAVAAAEEVFVHFWDFVLLKIVDGGKGDGVGGGFM